MSFRRACAVFHRHLSLWKSPRPKGFRRRCALIFATGLLLPVALVSSNLAQTTIHIPADQPTIQAGINAASNGDIVLVAPGTYYENIDFKGKAITVTSSGGAATTFIDGGGTGPAVTFKTGELRNSVVSNFTIQHGGIENLFFGDAGVYVAYSAPSILGNILTHNHCRGIHIFVASPLIQNNNVNNTEDAGGCAFAGGSAIWVEGAFQHNTGPSALLPTILGNVIENNTQSGKEDAGGSGGAGIAVWGGTPIIQNNVIRNNKTLAVGGGINVVSGGAVIVQNLIYGNIASGAGGLSFDFGTAQSPGPVVGFVVNNTIANNTTTGQYGYTGNVNGSQLYIWLQSSQTAFINNVVYGASTTPLVICDPTWELYTYQDTIFDHNDVYNSLGPLYGGTCTDKTGTFGNISADPQFVNAAAFDFHLTSASPAIDAGNNSAPYLPAEDFDSKPRQTDFSGKGYSVVDIGTYEVQGPLGASQTILTLVPSAYLINAGLGLTLSSQAMAVNGPPTGSVDFLEDGNRIATVLIGASGTATLPIQGLTPGLHSFVANYPGQGSFSPAVSVVTFVVVNKYVPGLSLVSSANPSLVSQPVTFTATITSPDGIVLSPVVITDGSTTLAILTPNSAGTATFTTSTLSLGTHYIVASYTGDQTHNSASATLIQQVLSGNSTSVSITSSLNPASYGQTVTFTANVTNTSTAPGTPAGSIAFSDGTTLLATQSLSSVNNTTASASFSTSALDAGTHAITATYVPSSGFAGSSATLAEVVTGIASATGLGASPNPSLFGQPVALTATITGSSTVPSGSLTFYDGTAAFATVPLDASGHANLTTTILAVGMHTLTAVYAGNFTYAASTSAAVFETINPLPQDFTISLANPNITIRTQHHTTTTVTLASVNGFSDTLTISCANLPQYLTCRPTPGSTMLASGGSATVSLYLDTDSVLGYARNSSGPLPGPFPLPIMCALLFGPVTLLGCLRLRSNVKPTLRLVIFLLAMLPLSVALAGCGDIIIPADIPPSVAPGTYIIPITATGAVTGISHTAQLSLQVTP